MSPTLSRMSNPDIRLRRYILDTDKTKLTSTEVTKILFRDVLKKGLKECSDFGFGRGAIKLTVLAREDLKCRGVHTKIFKKDQE